jgi:hypothetical protein
LNQLGILEILQFIECVGNCVLRQSGIQPMQGSIQFLFVEGAIIISFHIGTVNIPVPHVLEQFYDGTLIVCLCIKS